MGEIVFCTELPFGRRSLQQGTTAKGRKRRENSIAGTRGRGNWRRDEEGEKGEGSAGDFSFKERKGPQEKEMLRGYSPGNSARGGVGADLRKPAGSISFSTGEEKRNV